MRGGSTGEASAGAAPAAASRHYSYTMHFPLPPTEPEHAPHDANQRHILLHGVGRQRDDAKHAVKKMTKGNILYIHIRVYTFDRQLF